MQGANPGDTQASRHEVRGKLRVCPIKHLRGKVFIIMGKALEKFARSCVMFFPCFCAFAQHILCLPASSSDHSFFNPFSCSVIFLGCGIWGYSVCGEQRWCYYFDPLSSRDDYNFPRSISLKAWDFKMATFIPSAPAPQCLQTSTSMWDYFWYIQSSARGNEVLWKRCWTQDRTNWIAFWHSHLLTMWFWETSFTFLSLSLPWWVRRNIHCSMKVCKAFSYPLSH